MSDEMLIEAVREYSFLYDITDVCYHDQRKKENAWQQISEKFDNMSAGMCKKRRDSFRKTYKLRKTTSGQAAKKRKLWRYEEIMSFVVPYLAEREQISNISEPTSADQQDQDLDAVSDTQSLVGSEQGAEDSPLIPEEITEPSPRPTVLQTPKSLSSWKPKKNFKKDKNEKNPPVGAVLQEYLSTKQKSGEIQKSKCDALTTFFKAMEDTVRGFSPANIIEAKGEIAALVNRLELKNLREQSMFHKQNQPSYPYWSDHSSATSYTPTTPSYPNVIELQPMTSTTESEEYFQQSVNPGTTQDN